MNGHTPGPLLVVPHPDEDCTIFAIVDGARPEHLRSFADGFATVWSGSGGNSEANARLIAAAPDLLEILETTRGNIISLRDAGLPGPLSEWLKAVEAAIAKATGAP